MLLNSVTEHLLASSEMAFLPSQLIYMKCRLAVMLIITRLLNIKTIWKNGSGFIWDILMNKRKFSFTLNSPLKKRLLSSQTFGTKFQDTWEFIQAKILTMELVKKFIKFLFLLLQINSIITFYNYIINIIFIFFLIFRYKNLMRNINI